MLQQQHQGLCHNRPFADRELFVQYHTGRRVCRLEGPVESAATQLPLIRIGDGLVVVEELDEDGLDAVVLMIDDLSMS